jgi:phage N-6-adenine-methyltransferase
MTRNIARSDTETPKDTWNTPDKLFRVLDNLYHFTRDASASESNTKVKDFWSIEDDALTKDWTKEIVFCNPPFSQLSKDEKWVEKFISMKEGCVVLPGAIDTKWFHRLLNSDGLIYVFSGRIKYTHPTILVSSPTFPSILYFKTSRDLEFFTDMLNDNGFPGSVLRRL